MSSRRLASVAVVTAVLSVVLWWLSRDVITVAPPEVDPPAGGDLERVHTNTALLLAAVVTAGLTMLLTTLAALRRIPRSGPLPEV